MSIKHYIQYHNADRLETYPTEHIDLGTKVENLILDDSVKYEEQIYTSKKEAAKSIGNYCFLIVGKSDKVKKYYLWKVFKIEGFTMNQDGYYIVSGTGNDFKKPILLNDLEQFNEFRRYCGNFGLGFQNIENSNFCKTLISLSSSEKLKISSSIELKTFNELKSELEILNERMKSVEPEKRFAEIEKTLRKDNRIVEKLKKMTDYKCQFPKCNSEVLTKKGRNYVEVAHVKPVHKGGQSILGNLIVLCPNHHKEFDYGDLEILEQTESVLKGILNGRKFKIALKNYR